MRPAHPWWMVALVSCNDPGAVVTTASSSGDTSTSGTMAPTTVAEETSSVGAESSTAAGTDTAADASTGGETTTDLGTSDAASSSGGGGDASTSTGTDTGPLPGLPCPAGDLGAAVPVTVVGSTVGQDDEFTGSCGGGGAPDMAFTFTPALPGRYAFDTFGSILDTILYVQDGTCEGVVLACDDDGIGDQSVVFVDLAADQTVTVVVDGLALAPDPFVLSVRPGDVACPRDDLGEVVPKSIQDSTAIAQDAFDPSCGTFDAVELGYTFTAPSAGTYTFAARGQGFDALVAVFDGTCGALELACNNDALVDDDGSGVLVDLAAGQTVTVVVEGLFGTMGVFDLDVGGTGGVCPDDTLDDDLPLVIAGDLGVADNTTAGSCGGAFGADDLFAFAAPTDGFYLLSTAGAAFDTVLWVRDGACDGVELACNDDVGFADPTSALVVPLLAGQPVIVGVDAIAAGGAYALDLDVVPCAGDALDAVLPVVEAGTTAGAANVRAGSCGGVAAPEIAHVFTAPLDGVYSFDTFGSELDTVLYVLDGTGCDGPELACNDDDGGLQSQLDVALGAGSTVTVVVDGYSTNFGGYTLTIDD